LGDVERQMLVFLEEISLPDRFHRWVMTRTEKMVKGQQEELDARPYPSPAATCLLMIWS
jgi:hypothetical protein